MLVKLLKGKIHRARITEANLNYVGSITIDQDIMDAAGILPNEVVLVADINNGSRFETYVMPGRRGSGIICANGAAARLVSVGDIILVLSFGYFTEEEARLHKPKIAIIDEENNTVKEIL